MRREWIGWHGMALAAGGLRAIGLAGERGGRHLFAGLDIDLRPGQALVLAGPNGSGKSSLLRLLAGFGRPAAGRLFWRDSPVADDPEVYQGALHFIGHQDGLRPTLTVAETLGFWAALAGSRILPADILPVLGLGGVENLACRLLSAGQRRRLALTRLLTVERPLWLLDEPMVGLDAEAQGAFARLIAAHRQAGGMVVVSTHQPLDLPDAAILALDAHRPAAADLAEAWV